MRNIEQTYEIAAPISTVWRCLVDPGLIEEWGGGPAEMSDEIGADFRLWDGDIWGENIAVEAPNLLKQEWYGGDWERPSIVTITLEEQDGGTLLTLHQTGVPEEEIPDIEGGWQIYYLGPLKEMAEDEQKKA